MAIISKLNLNGIRNLQDVSIEASSSLNLFFGANGSGKTSLLEAIHLLARGRSFRTPKPTKFIAHGDKSCQLYGHILVDLGSDLSLSQGTPKAFDLGVQKSTNGDQKLILNGQTQTNHADIAKLLPMQVIAPDMELVTDTNTKKRQQKLDWGLFYADQTYIKVWRKAQNILKQRNALLKQGPRSKAQLPIWDTAWASVCIEIDSLRQVYVSQLKETLGFPHCDWLNGYELDLVYHKGWSKSMSIEESLEASLEKDITRGFTSCGCHRADFSLMANGQLAKDILSRGQKKILNGYFCLAQSSLLSSSLSIKPIILLDDPVSELDAVFFESLLKGVSQSGYQVFATAISREIVGVCLSHFDDIRCFQILEGSIKRLSIEPALSSALPEKEVASFG